MEEHALLQRVADVFTEYGFESELRSAPRHIDGEMVLEKGGVRRSFALEVKLPLTLSALQRAQLDLAGHDGDVIYITDQISERTAEALRRLNISFADAAGNVFLVSGDWYVDVRGRRRRDIAVGYATATQPANLFSSKRAQVLFVLLTWTELLDATVRTIADAAGVSLGIAQSTTTDLRRRDLWPDHEPARSTLIDEWVAAFPYTLARSLTIRAVRAEQLDRFFGPVLVSGEAAPSAQLRATSGVVYVDELSTDLLLMNRWRTDGPPNLVVRRRFWSHPEPTDGEAPPLLVYADLLASDDPRVRSVATEYRRLL